MLDKHERQPGEEAPIGLILCAESSREQVELLQMHKDGITVAEYWTELWQGIQNRRGWVCRYSEASSRRRVRTAVA
jgi:hypothetical protein